MKSISAAKFSVTDIIFILAGAIAVISAFVSYVDASSYTILGGWKTSGTTVFDLYHHTVGGKLVDVSWIRATAVAIPVCGLITVICGILPAFTKGRWTYILGIVAGTVALSGALMFMLMGANVNVFSGSDAVTYGAMLESDTYKLELASGFYMGIVSSAAMFITSLVNSRKLL